MAVLKHTSPTAMPTAPAPLPSITVRSASTSSAVGRSSHQGAVARAREFRASAAGMSGLSFIGFRCAARARRLGLKSVHVLSASRPTLLPRIQRAQLLSHAVQPVKLWREIFSCENKELSGRNPLPHLWRSITFETSSSIHRDLTHARNHHRRTQTCDQGARQAPRLDSAAIKDRDIAARTAGKGEATDAELLELFAKMIKQREESEKIYRNAGRGELATQEAEEIAIIREFLPEQLSEADTQKAIADAIAEAGATSVKDMGKVMAALKARYAGQMDFGKVSALVKAKLG